VTAVSSTVVRYGHYNTHAVTGEVYGYGDEPDIWAHVCRDGLRVRWEITAGKDGEPLAWGTAWTKGGARWKAFAAAHRPGIAKELTR
jgi:hypothetical protein